MYLNCPRCRTNNEPDALYCKNCGNAFAVKQTRKNSIATPLIIIGSILAVCGFCGVFGLITGDKKQVTQSPSSNIKYPAETTSANNKIVSSLAATLQPDSDDERMATVITENDNLRKTNSAKAEVFETVSKDSTVEVVKQSGPWFYVRTIGGQSGWLHGDTIRLNSGVRLAKPAKKPTVEPQATASPHNEPTKSEDKITDSDSDDIETNNSSRYITGPRGGCYYINRNGNKTYVDHSFCGTTGVIPRISSSSSGNGRYIRGPRGGCYYINGNGNKTYVDRSLCD